MSGGTISIEEDRPAGGFPISDRKLMEPFLSKPGFLLARVDQICTAIFSGLSDNTTLSQAEFLLLLDRLGPMIQIELARAAGVDKSTTAYILDNLQARGWTERTVREHDRRSSLISLTPAGIAALPQIKRDFSELQSRLEKPFDPLEMQLLVTALNRLGQNGSVPAPLWRTACDPPAGVLDLSLSFLTRRVLQLMHGQFLALTAEHGITLRQFSLLFLLSKRVSLTQTEFARLFGLDPATCAVIMRAPTRRGLIASQPSSEDGRARIYTLTANGADILREVQSLVDKSEAEVFRSESAKSREYIIAQLRIIMNEYSHLLRFPGAIGPA